MSEARRHERQARGGRAIIKGQWGQGGMSWGRAWWGGHGCFPWGGGCRGRNKQGGQRYNLSVEFIWHATHHDPRAPEVMTLPRYPLFSPPPPFRANRATAGDGDENTERSDLRTSSGATLFLFFNAKMFLSVLSGIQHIFLTFAGYFF